MEEKDYLLLPYISSSSLHWFERSPYYCFKKMNQEIAEEEKSYMDLGTQIHLKILEPKKFEECYTNLDFEKPTSKNQIEFAKEYANFIKIGASEEDALITAYSNNYSTKTFTSQKSILTAAEQLRKELGQFISYLLLQDKYKDILSSSKYNLIESVRKALSNNKKANELLFGDELVMEQDVYTYNELSILWDYPIYFGDEGPIKCKSKIDRLIVNHKKKEITLVDLKTTFSLSIIKEQFLQRNLYRQLSFYWLAVQQFFQEHFKDKNYEEYKKETYLVITTTDPELVETRVIKVSDKDIVEKQLEIAELMLKISWHVLTGNWEHTREYYEGDGTEKL